MIQVVGLLRSGAVPTWVSLALLFAVATFFVPGSGAVGLLTSLPTTIGASALGRCAWLARASDAGRDGREVPVQPRRVSAP